MAEEAKKINLKNVDKGDLLFFKTSKLKSPHKIIVKALQLFRNSVSISYMNASRLVAYGL